MLTVNGSPILIMTETCNYTLHCKTLIETFFKIDETMQN